MEKVFDRKVSVSGRPYTKEELKARNYSNYMVKCKCGHTFLMDAKEKKKLCTHCGHYFYKDKKLEFMERLNYARKNI